MREFAPRTRLCEFVVYMDDEAVAYETAAEILRAAPNLSGLYHCGDGVEGVIRALNEADRGQDIFYICHERSPVAVQGLMDGVVDLVIANPMHHLAETTLRVITDARTGKPPDAAQGTIAFELITAENI